MIRATCLGLALAALALLPAAAQERPPVVVTPGSEQVYRVAVQRFAEVGTREDPEATEAFRRTVVDALEYSNVFRHITDAAFLGPVVTPPDSDEETLECSNWSQIGADALVAGEIERAAGTFTVSFRVWDTSRCRRLLRRRYKQSAGMDVAKTARRLADDVVEAFVGLRGVASTEIAFVSDRSGNKEIYVMNADGTDVRAATANRSINNFPSWSPSGDGIAYTSYRYLNRPFLFLSSRGAGRPGRLFAGLGDENAQYRGVFGPDSRLALVMSDGDAAEIYTIGLDGRRLRQLTHSRAIDVSPAWSPDGSRMAFVSDRTGAPHVYVMDADGSDVRRLTFDGSYNTNPSWSPDGMWIAYETRVGGQFDIWLIDPEGRVNVPLVTHPRSDEAPSWSPNSRKIVFSSTRRGRADLYVMDRDGENLRRLTRGEGNNTSPAWGPFPQ